MTRPKYCFLIRCFILLALLCSNLTSWGATRRPRVAVVLAGGGAKGVAHISALRLIEEAGIPIDMVVGTSMGSIIGGMYCMGYSPDSMQAIVGSKDWIKLIMDNPDFANSTLSGKLDNENYVLRMGINPERRISETGRGGVIQGVNVMTFLRELASEIPDSIDFNKLPVPFACVGTDAITGKQHVFRQGNVPLAIRASMSLPTVFTPVKINGSTYIDGGIADNFPVDVARKMGADIVIGVDLVIPITDQQLTNSAVDMLLHVIDLVSQERYRKNIAMSDIYIPIDVTGYSAASFNAAAMDTLMQRGTYYASLHKASLDSLAKALKLPRRPHYKRIGEYHYADVRHKPADETVSDKGGDGAPFAKSLHSFRSSYLRSTVSLAGRFDNDEYASILLGFNMKMQGPRQADFKARVRLGQRIGAMVDASIKSFSTQRIGISYHFRHRDMSYFIGHDKGAQITSNYHLIDGYISQEWRNISYRFGLNYNIHHYQDVLLRGSVIDLPDSGWERYFRWYLSMNVNSLDRQYFPTQGAVMETGVQLIGQTPWSYHDHLFYPIGYFYYMHAISPNSRFTLMPRIEARISFHDIDDTPMALSNVIGGYARGMQIDQQMTMAGLPYIQYDAHNAIGVVGIRARQRIFNHHFIVVQADAATMCNHPQSVFDSESISWGILAGYNIRTAAGPLSATAHWSDLNHSFSVVFNAGFYF